MVTHFVFVPPPGPLYRWLWFAFQKNGAYGVVVFFVVSGFLITRLIDGRGKGLFKPALREFYVRRLARIAPLFFAVVLLGLGVTFLGPPAMPRFRYCFFADPGQFNGGFWLSLFTFTFNWYCAFGAQGAIGTAWGLMWSLSVEEQFYLFYPLLLRRLGSLGRLWVFLLAVIASGPLWRWAVAVGAPSYAERARFASFGSFDQIAWGALLYIVVKSHGDFFRRRSRLCAAACLSGAALLAAAYFATDPGRNLADNYFAFSLVALGAFLFLLGGLHLPVFGSRFLAPLAWPGKYSYGVYLLHIFVFYFAYPLIVHWQNLPSAYLLFVLFSTGVATLSYRFFEAPANRAVRRAFGLKAV